MARKSAVVEEVEELDDDLELEEDDDEIEEAPAPKAKAKAARKAPAKTKETADGYGISWLVDHLEETTGTKTSPAGLRVLLHKMANDGDLDREVGTDRSRYSFTGEKDATVRAVVKAVKGGALTKARNDNLAAARAAKAAKAEAAVADAPAKTKRSKKSAEVEEPTPAKPTRKRRG